MCTIVYVEETPSTNSLMAKSAAMFEHGTAIAAHTQTSGRGQRTNKWESEPHKNLTFSLLLKPKRIMAAHQFELLQSVAISIADVLADELGTDKISIKWPNDIYYRDSKLCGILIENVISTNRIVQSIIGVGINVNQKTFTSDAPNPVSMTNISGRNHNLDPLLEKLVNTIVGDFDNYEKTMNSVQLAAKYRFKLWRHEGLWPYTDCSTGETFNARIAAISPTGHITLNLEDGTFRTYAFKEVASVI